MKLLVDVSRLAAEEVVTQEQAATIRRIAAQETSSLAINLLSTLGVMAVVGGVVALEPGFLAMAALGVVLVAAGILLETFRSAQFGFLGGALAIIGVLLHAAAVLIEWQGSMPAFGYVTLVLVALGILLKHGFLIALSVFSLAALLGSSTGYWHAAYALWVREATFTIVVFALLATVATMISRRVAPAYRRLARLFALISVIWINFGFWVGSLWGDHPGESWVKAELTYGDATDWGRLQEWRQQAFDIPSEAFAIVWALGLIGLGAWGATRNQRAVVNATTTFAAIHFYTQWFERLSASPGMVIAAGAFAIAFAFGLWRYNQRKPAASQAS